MDLLIEVLKWIALIFLAGAIGQFGKALTQKLLERGRAEEAPYPAGPTGPADVAADPANESPEAAKERAKAEKKRAKAAAKILKKQQKKSL